MLATFVEIAPELVVIAAEFVVMESELPETPIMFMATPAIAVLRPPALVEIAAEFIVPVIVLAAMLIMFPAIASELELIAI